MSAMVDVTAGQSDVLTQVTAGLGDVQLSCSQVQANDGQALLKECLDLFEEDKVFQASRAERRLRAEHPAIHASNLAALSHVQAVAEEAQGLLGQLVNPDTSGWTVVRERKNAEDVRVLHKPQPDSAVQSIMIEADMRAPLASVLVLLNEVDMYNQWLPFIGGNKVLDEPKRTVKDAWIKIWAPWPIYSRDVCLRAYAVDGLDEDGCVLAVLHTCREGETKVALPPEENRTVRMVCEYAVLQLIPVSENHTKIRGLGHIDPKLAVLPAWLLNWVATKVCHVGIKAWEAEAIRVSQGKGKGGHAKAMETKQDFYAWLNGLVDSFFAKAANGAV